MKIGIYNQCRENQVLASVSAAVLAAELARDNETEIIENGSSSILFPADLTHVRRRSIAHAPQSTSDPNRPHQRYQALRNWSDELTRPYDLFINFTDRLPLFCAATRCVLVVQFPYDFIPRFYRPLWLEHLASYQLILANSYYTRFWTKVFWDLECEVIYPPVVTQTRSATKENLILGVGSFDSNRFRGQLQLISAFAELKQHLPDWSLVITGNADGSRSTKRYLDEIGAAAAAEVPSVMICPNLARNEERELIQRARLLWHASGTSHELDLQPQRVEPFNLIVTQGMAVGCVPLVMNTGSLAELVKHGENGFFWDTVDELVACTLRVVGDESLGRKLIKAGKQRSLAFRPQVYVDSFSRQLERAFGVSPMASKRWNWKRFFSYSHRASAR